MTDTTDVAAQTPELHSLKSTLETMGGDFARIADWMDYLWENPGAFEDGELDEDWKRDHALLAFEMGVLFGIDYEQAYPQGRRDEWPIPLDERPSAHPKPWEDRT